jgi:hypothetical protein
MRDTAGLRERAGISCERGGGDETAADLERTVPVRAADRD